MKHRYCHQMRLWGSIRLKACQKSTTHGIIYGVLASSPIRRASSIRFFARGESREHEYELVPGYYEQSLNHDLQAADRTFGRHRLHRLRSLCLGEASPELRRALLGNGTVVCFDDYYNYNTNPTQGEQEALAEFLDENAHFQFIEWLNYSPLGKSFVVRVKDDGSG